MHVYDRVALKDCARRDLRSLALVCAAVVSLALCAFAPAASAFTEPGFTGKIADLENCSVEQITPSIELTTQSGRCAHGYTTGGVVQIGHSSVPITVPGDTFDAASTIEEPETPDPLCAPLPVCAIAPPHGVLNGPAQPVPGGLLGTIGNVQLTGVTAKLEWATAVTPGKPFGTVTVCGADPLVTLDLCKLLNGQPGTAVTLRAKIHLMSPFLGQNCYIGSATSPIVIPLTTGTTNPPPPAKPIHGKPTTALLALRGLRELLGTTLVNNSFSVPVAHGCGTSGGTLVDVSIDHKLGLPSPAGMNMMVLQSNGEESDGRELLENGWKPE